MITIYGSPHSSAGRCFWCLEELEVKYEVKPINFREKQHKSPDYLKLNPNGKVPTLTDGDFVLWESLAINFYLADKYKPELLGEGVKARGQVYQWSIWALAELQVPVIDVFIQMVFVPEERRDAKIIEKGLEKIPTLLKTLDGCLEGRKYLVGETFTLADLNVASVATICSAIKFDLSPYKNIQNWMENLSTRKSFKKYLELAK